MRDLMMGAVNLDFDLMVEGSAVEAAEMLARSVPGTIRRHDRFLTAAYRSDDGALLVDFASARSETYSKPGALPEVKPADAESDLWRRDFTVNAMALALWRESLGRLLEFHGARDDLRNRLLRVTHDQSFVDDPTRLLRMLRYGARLGFMAEPRTERLARAAVETGTLSTVSGTRIRDELLTLLSEEMAVVAIESMAALRLDRGLRSGFIADEYVVSRALAERAPGVRRDLLLLALCSRTMDHDALDAWLAHLQIRKAESAVVVGAVLEGPGLLERVAETGPEQLGALLSGYPVETLIFALALPDADREASRAVRRWLAKPPGETSR